MKPKKEMKDGLDLAENLELAMLELGLRVADVNRKCDCSYNLTLKLIKKKSAASPTRNVLQIAKVLGFTEEQVEKKIREERIKNSKEKLKFFESKISMERKEK